MCIDTIRKNLKQFEPYESMHKSFNSEIYKNRVEQISPELKF